MYSDIIINIIFGNRYDVYTEQLELNLQKLETEEAQKTLESQRKIYAEISEK